MEPTEHTYNGKNRMSKKITTKTPVNSGDATGTERAKANQGMDAPTAVLIGATGGLGHALARLLTAEGFRIVLAARRAAALHYVNHATRFVTPALPYDDSLVVRITEVR